MSKEKRFVQSMVIEFENVAPITTWCCGGLVAGGVEVTDVDVESTMW